uniref:Secreted protein n=1 Tax=Mesocestoides corti TaxID=53468 RepID=A0A5K3G2W6_MESCO
MNSATQHEVVAVLTLCLWRRIGKGGGEDRSSRRHELAGTTTSPGTFRTAMWCGHAVQPTLLAHFTTVAPPRPADDSPIS